VLANIDISPNAIAMIPKKVALARHVLPFYYNPETGLLQIACEDPSDSALLDELAFLAKDARPKLYVAAELSLSTAIARYYEGHDTSLDDNCLLEIPDTDIDAEEVFETPDKLSESGPIDQAAVVSRGEILIVTDEQYAGPMMRSLFERDGFTVTMTDSADDAIQMIEGRVFDTVFIKDTVPGDYLDLIDRLRKSSPRTVVRYCESASSLLMNQDTIVAEGNLLTSNLEIFTSMLSLIERMPNNHSGAVGQCADRLCRKLGLPDKVRFQIVNAGYLHDLARYYYHLDPGQEQRKVIKLTAKLLQAIKYPPVIVEMLRSMYMNLRGKYTKRLPIEVLDRFEVVRIKFREVTGKLLLAEVVDAFCEMVEQEILQASDETVPAQVMIYADNPGTLFPVQKRLKSEGYHPLAAHDRGDVGRLWERRQPDYLVLVLHGNAAEIRRTVQALIEEGVDPDVTPCFVLSTGCTAAELTGILDLGVRDVLEYDVNLDLLINGLRKAGEDLVETARSQEIAIAEAEGTKGRLSDMNLIDLLQAMGPSRKTARMVVRSPEPPGEDLVLYLNRGSISHAVLGSIQGAEAVYRALAWEDGNWVVNPVAAEDLPEPNNDLPNESILMEGCRLLDEKQRQVESN